MQFSFTAISNYKNEWLKNRIKLDVLCKFNLIQRDRGDNVSDNG